MIWGQAIGSLGLAAGGLASTLARPRRGLAGGRRGGDWELTYNPNVAEGGSGAAPVSSVGGAGRRRPLRLDCWRDGGTGGVRRGVGRYRRSLGRGCVCVRNFAEGAGRSSPRRRWQPRRRTARAARQGRAGRRRCLNRPSSHGHDVGGEMLPCYGAPRRVRVRTGGPPRARRAYGAATGRRVARGLRCTAGRGSAWERSASRVVCGLGRRWPRAWTLRRPARGRGTRHTVRTTSWRGGALAQTFCRLPV
jgi:hypothetical protein